MKVVSLKWYAVMFSLLLLSAWGNKLQYDKNDKLQDEIVQLNKDKQGLDDTILKLQEMVEESKASCKANISQAIELTNKTNALSCQGQGLNAKIDSMSKNKANKAVSFDVLAKPMQQTSEKGDRGGNEDGSPRLADLDDVIPDCGELCRVLDAAYSAAKGIDSSK